MDEQIERETNSIGPIVTNMATTPQITPERTSPMPPSRCQEIGLDNLLARLAIHPNVSPLAGLSALAAAAKPRMLSNRSAGSTEQCGVAPVANHVLSGRNH